MSQFGITSNPMQQGEIKLIANRGFRNPTIREMYMFPPQNPDLKPENLWNYEISWTQRLFQNKLSYSVNVYFIKGKNMIQTENMDGRPKNVNTGTIENCGLELTTRYSLTSAFVFSATSSSLPMKNPVLAAPQNTLYVGVYYSNGRWRSPTVVQ